MIFVPSNSDDIRRYYEGTYVKLQEFGDKLFYLRKVRSDANGDMEVLLEDSDGETLVILLEEDAPYNMNFTLPHRAMFQYGGSAYILQRIPARQYKRGINTENTRIVDAFSGKVSDLSFKRLEAFVSKAAYSSVNEALYEKKNAKTIGVVLSQRIAFYCPQQVFYLDGIPFAMFNRADNTITPYSQKMYHLFAPELAKLCDLSYPIQPKFA